MTDVTQADYDIAEAANRAWGAAINGPHVAVLAAAMARESTITRLLADNARLTAERDGAYERAAQVDRRVAEEWDAYMTEAVSKAPEPLRQLGEYLADLLDEDQWKTAERYLNATAIRNINRSADGAK